MTWWISLAHIQAVAPLWPILLLGLGFTACATGRQSESTRHEASTDDIERSVVQNGDSTRFAAGQANPSTATPLSQRVPADPEAFRTGRNYARLTVEAGDVDRDGTPVSFRLDSGPRHPALLDASGDHLPVQLGSDGRYWFIVDGLQRGTSRSYSLVEAPDMPARVTAETAQGGRATFSTDGAPFIRYVFQPAPPAGEPIDSVYRRGGYIHPVLSPSGTILTDDYPPNHLHHHGIWAAWTRSEFKGRTPDFWNMGDRTGTVEPVALDTVWSGSVFAGLIARHAYVDLSGPAPENALDETWTIRVFPPLPNGIRMFDLEVAQTTSGADALHLPEYRYGGVGFRGHRQWNGADSAFFQTSEGRDRSDGHGTRARWCHVGGYVDGRLAGIAVLDHPENFRSPQPMRIHPDEPFFNYAPSQLGDFSIQPDAAYKARYRFITYDGAPEPEILDRLWNDLADPPVVHVDQE